MTKAAQEFVTPLSLASLSEDKVYSELWSLTDESEMGHIRLSREADLLVVAPATADLIARMAAGLADDLAATTLLASDKPVLIAPAMNAMMWAHPATQANLATLKARGVMQVGPGSGELACGEVGFGRMSEPADILAAITRMLTPDPAREPARRPARAGHLGSDPRADRPGALSVEPFLGQAGPCDRRGAGGARRRHGAGIGTDPGADPAGVRLVAVETARQMLAASEAALPVDVAVMAAAVSDWRVDTAAGQKMKKDGSGPPTLRLVENPDILATIAARAQRPAGAGGRLCRRDRERHRLRPRQARPQGLRLDPRERRVARHRHLRRRPEHHPPGRCRRGRGLAGHDQARGRRPPRRPHRRRCDSAHSGLPRHRESHPVRRPDPRRSAACRADVALAGRILQSCPQSS